MTRLEFTIAMRYLSTKHKDGFISIINVFASLGITLGVATLIIVMSVMNGYEKELIGKILGFKGHMAVVSINDEIKNYDDITKKLQDKVSQIKFAAPVVNGQGMLSNGARVSGVMIKGMTIDDLLDKPGFAGSLYLGIDDEISRGDSQFYTLRQLFAQSNPILLGVELAKTLQVSVGAEVKLIAPSTSSTIMGLTPKIKTFVLAGTFDTGMYEYNAGMAYIPLRWGQVFFNTHSRVSEIEIALYDLDDIESAQAAVYKVLASGSEHNHDNSDLVVVDWKQTNQSLASVLKVEQNVMFIILSLIIMIAAFNIISSLVILVKDKSKSIAILRTMGTTKSSIARVFILCGFTIGMVGTICGSTIGIVFALNINAIKNWLEGLMGIKMFDPMIYFLTTMPADLAWEQVFSIIAMSLFLSLLATIYPALKISRMSPTRVLRHE